MILPPTHLDVLQQIEVRLADGRVTWVITGSAGFALQGVPVEVHDIDLQCDEAGAYEIERRFAEYVVRPVIFSAAARIRSHFGALVIDGIEVEVMGDIQKRSPDGDWEGPVDLKRHRRWVKKGGVWLPVLSLAYEYGAYLKLGRVEKAEMLKRWLVSQGRSL